MCEAQFHVMYEGYAVHAMEAGKHVLVEKPMDVHLADARAILQAAGTTENRKNRHGRSSNTLGIYVHTNQ
jgi:hypothetical protein